MPPHPKRRKVVTASVEEVTFNLDDRQEFLTGFHKRKLQRAKHAQEAAERRAREERRQERRKVREERQAEFERALVEHKAQLKALRESEDSEHDKSGSDEEDAEWEGFAEPPAVDHEAEYIDEDKYTTVTVTEMDPSRDGLQVRPEENDSEEDAEGKHDTVSKTGKKSDQDASKPKKKRAWTKERPEKSENAKKKKRNFRYENKAERKFTRLKQRSGNKSKAKERKER